MVHLLLFAWGYKPPLRQGFENSPRNRSSSDHFWTQVVYNWDRSVHNRLKYNNCTSPYSTLGSRSLGAYGVAQRGTLEQLIRQPCSPKVTMPWHFLRSDAWRVLLDIAFRFANNQVENRELTSELRHEGLPSNNDASVLQHQLPISWVHIECKTWTSNDSVRTCKHKSPWPTQYY
jgi:hypothetical protein